MGERGLTASSRCRGPALCRDASSKPAQQAIHRLAPTICWKLSFDRAPSSGRQGNPKLLQRVQTSAMTPAPTRLICSSAAELRALCTARLEHAPSARVFDNRLNPPRSDYELNPAWRAERGLVSPAAVLVPIGARPAGLCVILIQRPGTMAAHPKVDAADGTQGSRKGDGSCPGPDRNAGLARLLPARAFTSCRWSG